VPTLGNEFDRTSAVRRLHPPRDLLRRPRAPQVDAEFRTIAEDMNVSGSMVVRIDPDHEPLDDDPRHAPSITYPARFNNSKRLATAQLRLFPEMDPGPSRQRQTRGKMIVTTVRDRNAKPAPDLVSRRFTADAPNQLWVADIRYVPTWSGFL